MKINFKSIMVIVVVTSIIFAGGLFTGYMIGSNFKDADIASLNDNINLLRQEQRKKIEVKIHQGVSHSQYRGLFRDILKSTGVFGDDAIVSKYADLCLFTAQVESDFGRLNKQVKGPALGWFQMEPKTEDDLHTNFIAFKPAIKKAVSEIRQSNPGTDELRTNIAYAVTMCALQYKRYIDLRGDHLPEVGDREGQTAIWKKRYNTYKGKGTATVARTKALALN